jgi:hypothetical protein
MPGQRGREDGGLQQSLRQRLPHPAAPGAGRTGRRDQVDVDVHDDRDPQTFDPSDLRTDVGGERCAVGNPVLLALVLESVLEPARTVSTLPMFAAAPARARVTNSAQSHFRLAAVPSGRRSVRVRRAAAVRAVMASRSSWS